MVHFDLNDPRRADARGWGPMYSVGAPRRTDMVPLQVGGVFFIGGVHPKLHDLLEILWTEALDRGYVLHDDPPQCWGFAWRAIRGSTAPSNHSSGTAVDANSAYNYLGRTDGGDVPAWLVTMFNRYGFRWGGDYSSRPDPMHWEAMFEAADADELTEMAKEEFMGLTPEEKATLLRAEKFLDALTEPLKPGRDAATAAGAGARVAKVVLAIESDSTVDLDGIDH